MSTIKSSLTDDEIHKICWELTAEQEWGRTLVDAAAQRAIEDLKMPPDDWYGSALSGPDRIRVMQYITAYVSHIKEGKL